jgi:hypothetical protein
VSPRTSVSALFEPRQPSAERSKPPFGIGPALALGSATGADVEAKVEASEVEPKKSDAGSLAAAASGALGAAAGLGSSHEPSAPGGANGSVIDSAERGSSVLSAGVSTGATGGAG